MILLLSILAAAYGQSCQSGYFKNDMSSPKSIDTDYCPAANLTNSSCCSSTQVDSLQDSVSKVYDTLESKFKSLQDLYQAKLSQVLELNVNDDQRQFIEFAALYAKVTSEVAISFQRYLTYMELYQAMDQQLSDMTDSWHTCDQLITQHEEGRQCLLCNPTYISKFTNTTGIDFSLNVCIKLMRECFGYIQQRVDMATYVNVINVLNVLNANSSLSQLLIQGNETFEQKTKFAQMLSVVPIDGFAMPDQCEDQFDCRFICNQFLTSTGVNYDIIVNPTYSSYKPSFSRILEIIDIVQEERRRLRLLQIQILPQSKPAPASTNRRQLIFYVQEFTNPYQVSYTFDAPNTIEIGSDSGLQDFHIGGKVLVCLACLISMMIL